MKFFFFAIFILGFTACGPTHQRLQDTDLSVVGGQDALAAGQYQKSIVSIWYPDKRSECTGTYLGDGLVLTAGHCNSVEQPYVCFSHQAPREIEYKKEFDKYCVRAKISAEHKHYVGDAMPFDIKNAHDIRLIKFDGNPPDDVTPMSLPDQDFQLAPKQVVHLSGFGLMSKNPVVIPSAIQIAEVEFVSRWSPTELLFEPYKAATACHGDSGGPVYVEQDGKLIVVGVVSRASVPAQKHTCHEGFVTVDVAAYLSWIHSAAQALKDSP